MGPIPEDIARKFIAKHKLKHGKKHTISGESELLPDIYEDQPQAGHSEGSSSIEEYVKEIDSHLNTVQTEVQRALDLLDKIRNKKEGESPIGEVEVAVEPQGGWANEEEEESSEEIASIQPLSSVKPIKSIKEVKSMKEVKKIYELSDEQARMLKA